MATDFTAFKNHLWSVADELRASSRLRSHEYSVPVLGLIFLRYADVKFAQVEARLKDEGGGSSRHRTPPHQNPACYHAEGVLFLPAEARFHFLVNRPEGEDIGRKINEAMKLVEDILDAELPDAYDAELYQEKCQLIYQHIYENYPGEGRSMYAGLALGV